MRKQYDGGYKDGARSPVRWRDVSLLLRVSDCWPISQVSTRAEARSAQAQGSMMGSSARA